MGLVGECLQSLRRLKLSELLPVVSKKFLLKKAIVLDAFVDNLTHTRAVQLYILSWNIERDVYKST